MFEFQYQREIRTDLKRRGDVEKHDVQPAWCKSDGLARRHVDKLHDPMLHYVSRHGVEVNFRPSRDQAFHRYQPITVGAPIDDGDIGGAGPCAFQRCPQAQGRQTSIALERSAKAEPSEVACNAMTRTKDHANFVKSRHLRFGIGRHFAIEPMSTMARLSASMTNRILSPGSRPWSRVAGETR